MAGFDPGAFNLADPRAQQVLQALREEIALVTPWRMLGQPVQAFFALANTQTEVTHLLGEVPDGMQILTSDASITREPGKQWTKDLAYLRSDRANAFCWVAFGMLRQEAFNVQSTS